jgi:hypothetical protein
MISPRWEERVTDEWEQHQLNRRCKGIHSFLYPYDEEHLVLLQEILPACREMEMQATHIGEVRFGSRFNNDDYVRKVLQSGYNAEDFWAAPITATRDALACAAESDFWYQHEKDYGPGPLDSRGFLERGEEFEVPAEPGSGD